MKCDRCDKKLTRHFISVQNWNNVRTHYKEFVNIATWCNECWENVLSNGLGVEGD